MKKKTLAISLATLCCTGAVLAATVTAANLNTKTPTADEAYKLILNNSTAPTELAGTTSEAPVTTEFTSRSANANIPVTYNFVYASSEHHLNMVGKGTIALSTGSGSDINDITYVDISLSSGSLILRYGQHNEEHSMIVSQSGKYYISGNWFQLRNVSNSDPVTDIDVEVGYPCTEEEFVCGNNNYFDEDFSNIETSNDNICIDADAAYVMPSSYGVADGKLDVVFGGSAASKGYINSYGQFTENFEFSTKVKFTDSNTSRITFYVGKTKTTNSLWSGTVGTDFTSIEINVASGSSSWVRFNNNGNKMLGNLTLADPHTDYVTYTVKTDSRLNKIHFYENNVYLGSMDGITKFDGFVGISNATSGATANYSFDKISVSELDDFAYSGFTSSSWKNNLSLSIRNADTVTIDDDGYLNAYLNSGYLYSLKTIKEGTISFEFKNTTDGRLLVLFGDTDLLNKTYGGGGNMADGMVGVVITDTWIGWYDNGADRKLTNYSSVGTQTSFVSVSLTIAGKDIIYDVGGNKGTINLTKAIATAGNVAFGRGNGASTTIFKSMSLTTK